MSSRAARFGLLTLLFYSSVVFGEDATDSVVIHRHRDFAVEGALGMAAGLGVMGGGLVYGVSERVDVVVTGGVDLHNTHLGLQGRYYFIPERPVTPMAYATIASMNYQGAHTPMSGLGAGVAVRFRSGMYLQAQGGWARFLGGEDREAGSPGFFEVRPIVVGYRF